MCNLSDGIEERAAARATKIATEKATAETKKALILKMYNRGDTLEQIAEVTDISKDAIEEIIREKDLVLLLHN